MGSKRPAKKDKDLVPKSGVKGGGGASGKIATNDNMTLVRGAKPAPKRKDLPARKGVVGGKKTA